MKNAKKEISHSRTLRDQLLDRFNQSGAHVGVFEALDNLTWQQAGSWANEFSYTIWQLAEHIRITQHDILEFSKNDNYQSPPWPVGYWPEGKQPLSEEKWVQTITQIKSDQEEFSRLLIQHEARLLEPFDYGTGQSLFLEALLIIDHTAYHTGQIILIRKLKGLWPPSS